LLSKILNYYERRQAFTHNDFTLSQLSNDLNSNNLYVGQAIALTGMNFSEFTNKYRVEMVKKMIAQGDLNKYAFRHIYTKAGFRSQSAFNENFKKFEGMTPNEYKKKRR
jgi:YesN/AraC family two-component response regulator